MASNKIAGIPYRAPRTRGDQELRILEREFTAGLVRQSRM
jgi:hypothetical protein